MTPLHIAAESGQLSVCQLIISNIEDKNPKATYGLTPFHLAAEAGHLDICQLFISNIEDNKNPGDLFNWTPLHYAALHGHLKICQLIVSKIEDKNPRNICGQTPLDFARKTHKNYAAICDLLRH